MGKGPHTTAAFHPTAVELTDFALGRLHADRTPIVEGHVYCCSRCAEFVSQVPADDFVELLHTTHAFGGEGSAHSVSEIPLSCSDGKPKPSYLDGLPPEWRSHDRYQVLQHIADGATGAVYRAVIKDSSQVVALKTLKPELARDERKVNRFLQEVKVASKLRNRHIGRLLGSAVEGQLTYIVLEYIEGSTLAQIVRQRGPLPVEEACRFLQHAATALAYAAQAGVVHRDVKPQNLMVETATSTLKVLDFGLGRLLEDPQSGSRLTREGEVLGTPLYIAPEQASNSREADARSDIYSLGCTLYFLLAGAPPFQARSALELLQMHATAEPMSISTLRNDIPEEVDKLLRAMMQKDPARRPQTSAEIVDALAEVTPTSTQYVPREKTGMNQFFFRSHACNALGRQFCFPC